MILFVLCLVLYFGGAVYFLYPSSKELNAPFIPKPENENFLDLQQKYSHELEKSILNILEPLTGRDKVRVAIQLDLNLKNAKLNRYTHIKPFSEESISLQQSAMTHASEKQVHSTRKANR